MKYRSEKSSEKKSPRTSRDAKRRSEGGSGNKRTANSLRKKSTGRVFESPTKSTVKKRGKLQPTTTVLSSTGEERLQKVLARAGIASRRNSEVLILEGSVTVNGKVITELGTKVDASKDKIKVDGKLIFPEVDAMYVACYKPKGCIASFSDPEGRMHLGNVLRSIKDRIFPVGRLNYNSEGLMLLTNDGALLEKIVKSRELVKTYHVKVKGHPTERDIDTLKRGIFATEGVVRFTDVKLDQSLKNKVWIRLEVIEGSQLDLRELLNRRGFMVDRIVRSAIGGITLEGLEPGDFRMLSKSDFEALTKEQEH